jgi:hypothetical protein
MVSKYLGYSPSFAMLTFFEDSPKPSMCYQSISFSFSHLLLNFFIYVVIDNRILIIRCDTLNSIFSYFEMYACVTHIFQYINYCGIIIGHFFLQSIVEIFPWHIPNFCFSFIFLI